jgi:hypothetical protein
MRIQPPKAFIPQNPTGYDTESKILSSGIKTLFPKEFDVGRVGRLASQIPAGAMTGSAQYVTVNLDGVDYSVRLVRNEQNKAITFHPDWNQPVKK